MQFIRPLVIALTAAIAIQAASRGGWQEQPALSVDPSIIRVESNGVKSREGQPVLELLEDTHVRFDQLGRRESHYRYIFRIDHESAIDGWRSISAVWKPWHQERPVLRARVITPDGGVHLLDPATIGEFPINEDATNLYDDRKRLAAPLPQLCVGAIAEVEIITRETAPVHKVGTLSCITLHQPVPVLRTHVLIDLPESLPLKVKAVGAGIDQPTSVKMDGRVHVALDLGPTEPSEHREPSSDPDVQPLPSLTYTTVPSWADAAASYAEIVERQISGANLDVWVKEAVGDAVEPREKIDRILARMNKTIRYTGVEFGDAGVVPRTPAETLTRGFGDCKDKSTLLVALLRAAGIPAHVALLETGPGKDVDPVLPGLNYFDHAIVFVPGPPALWIDPTMEFGRAGEIPFADQGRMALVAASPTMALRRTPALSSRDNLVLETREIYLAESGKARIVETSIPNGFAELHLRSDFAHTETKVLRENLKRYIQGAYTADDLGQIAVGDPSDLTKPFTVRIEVLGSNIALTSDVDAVVTLNAWAMGKTIRNLIPTSFDRTEKEPVTARKTDLIWPQPYAIEWRYRIIPQPGFKAKPLPESDRLEFGPASLSRKFVLAPDGVVLATFTFDSGKNRWTPAEVESARTGMESFGKSTPTQIRFDQVGEAQLAAGKVMEAIQTFRRETQDQPSKGVPRSRLAIALIRGGIGEAARDEARKACDLEPGVMFTHRALGWVLSHDLVNRHYHPGWDYEGAIAEYRKAKTLNPKDALTRKNLAILLEHNAEGIRYAKDAPLDQAIQEYRDLRKDLQVEDMNINLLILLWRTRQFKELEECAKTLPTSENVQAWQFTAVTINRGIEAAQKELSAAIPDQGARRKVLLRVADNLVQGRYYSEGTALLATAADGDANAPSIRSRIAVLGKAKRIEEIELDPSNPTTVLWSLYKSVFNHQATEKDLLKFMTPKLGEYFSGNHGLKDLRKVIGVPAFKRDGTGTPNEVLLDILFAMSHPVVDGNEIGGYRIRFQSGDESNSRKDAWFVVREKGRFLLAAYGGEVASLGVEALRRLDLNDLVGARSMLDRAREIVWAGNGDEPLSGHPFCRFWTKGQETSANGIRIAAITLLTTEDFFVQVLSELKKVRQGERDEATRIKLDLAMMMACKTQSNWAELTEISERLYKAYPASKAAGMLRVLTMMKAKKWPELLLFLDDRLKNDSDDPDLLRSRAHVLGMLGRLPEEQEFLKGLIDTGRGTASTFNTIAWNALIQGQATEQTAEWARRSLQLKSEENESTVHTLASILAERGEITEALELFYKRLNALQDSDVKSEDWYLIGRIAEGFGEKKAAVPIYKRVDKPEKDEPVQFSCYALAERRLKALGES